MMGLNADQLRLLQIFFPRVFDAYGRILQKQTRFVQYTRAESAIKLLRSGTVWMRKPQWMNDYREIEHGLDCLIAAYDRSEAGKRFRSALDKAFPNITKSIQDSFNPWVESYRSNTYVACVSEHDDEEDVNGRLSMWRAYGGGTGVALVVKSAPFTMVSDELGAYSSPVSYLDQAGVEAHFSTIADAIEKDMDFVQSRQQGEIEYLIHEAFRYGILCNKHPGFAEEREWRIIYSPDRDTKKVLTKSIEVIGGEPQPVYRIPLKDISGYTSLAVADILDRIIIGPTRFPSAALESFRAELNALNVPDADKKVVVSDIPLRT